MAVDETRLAFARAAAEDGIAVGGASFDWLCEQGHVGLERVAKARRDPALVTPVTAALGTLGEIFARLGGDLPVLRASRENLLLPLDLVHAPTGTVIEVDLATPAMGHPLVVRVAAADGDGEAAYRRHRDALLTLAARAPRSPRR